MAFMWPLFLIITLNSGVIGILFFDNRGKLSIFYYLC